MLYHSGVYGVEMEDSPSSSALIHKPVLGLAADEICSHLIGCVYVDAILNVFQGLIQVSRTGSSKKTVACICLQPREKGEEKGRGGG